MNEKRMPRGHAVAIAVMLASITAGCTSTPKPDDQQRLGATYADILVAQQQAGNDTLVFTRTADSIAKAHKYNGYKAVLQEIKEASSTIESLRPVLDTATHRLEKINRGQNPDSLPPTTVHPEKR